MFWLFIVFKFVYSLVKYTLNPNTRLDERGLIQVRGGIFCIWVWVDVELFLLELSV